MLGIATTLLATMALATGKRAKIVLFGDSITQMSFSASDGGWGAYIADRYQRRADVYNRGFSGYNTDWFLKYASTDAGKADLFEHEGVKLCTIFFGANDASDHEHNRRQHVPLEDYKNNIRQIVNLAKTHFGVDVQIILMTPPPVCHEGRLKFQKERYKDKATGVLERSLELSGKYAKALEDIASELNLPLLDLWGMMQLVPSWPTLLSDGLHLSPTGNRFVGEALLSCIERLLPELAVKPCPETGNINSSSECQGIDRAAPWHDEVDHTQPEKAFENL
jgi:lysophospholipase L1-like esterase